MSGAKSSFVVRILKVNITSPDGSVSIFDGSPVSMNPFVPGLFIETDIENALLPQPGGMASVRIHGMTLSEVNRLSIAGRLWRPDLGTKLEVFAGDSSSPNLTLIHSGQIIEARPEFSGMPSTPFFISAMPGLVAQMNNTVTGTSVNGSVSAASLLGQICEKAGIGYTDADGSAANAKLAYFHTSGSAHDQIVEVILAAKIRGVYDVFGDLVTFAQNGSIPSSEVTISPKNGMIGYPEFQAATVSVRTIFDPEIAAIVAGPGHQIQIQSQLTAATGKFVITQIGFHLSCNDPSGGGPWELDLLVYPSGLGASGA